MTRPWGPAPAPAHAPSPEEFARLARRYPVVPVWRELLADTETPIGLFRRLGEGAVALLESVEMGERRGRYSFLGLDPVTTLLVHDGHLSWTDGPICPVPEGASLAETLRAVAAAMRSPRSPDLPLAAGGAICALGGDALRDPPGAGRPGSSGSAEPPDSAVVFPSAMIIFDHFAQRLRLVVLVRVVPGRPAAGQYGTALARLDALAGRLAASERAAAVPVPVAPAAEVAFDSDVPDDAYRKMVQAAHRRVAAGELRQVTISRRFGVPTTVDPLAAYRVLRVTNPSPYLYLLRLPGITLVGSSPQGVVTARDGRVSAPVIAGTRPRGEDADTDAKMARELLADPKERDEHAMLVELVLADLVPIAQPGTVRVTGPRVVRYSRVMHLVTDVTAALGERRGPLDALAAAFPSGTVTGTPRQAALRLIDEVEPRRRGLYGGAVGYLDFAGDLDMCLAVRTLQFHGGMAYCQAGAGVVAGSVPELEVRESRAKASALFAALYAAASHGGLG